MLYQLSYRLGKSAPPLDPDAKAYIDAVVAAGATVTGTQSKAISDFVKTGKTDGWYTSIKRIYLPIWASASPNAVDMIGLTSGTFNGTVTHSTGYVQGDGSTGYFDFGISPSAMGIANTSGFVGSLIKTTDPVPAFNFPIGARDLSNKGQVSAHQYNSATEAIGYIGRSSSGDFSAPLTVSAVDGILLSNRNGDGLKLVQRKSSGVSRSSANTSVATDAITSFNLYGLAVNSDGVASNATDMEIGSLFAGTGITTDVGVDAFTLALKNLWETCTGLTLP
jgi:hypothetical protein